MKKLMNKDDSNSNQAYIHTYVEEINCAFTLELKPKVFSFSPLFALSSMLLLFIETLGKVTSWESPCLR